MSVKKMTSAELKERLSQLKDSHKLLSDAGVTVALPALEKEIADIEKELATRVSEQIVPALEKDVTPYVQGLLAPLAFDALKVTATVTKNPETGEIVIEWDANKASAKREKSADGGSTSTSGITRSGKKVIVLNGEVQESGNKALRKLIEMGLISEDIGAGDSAPRVILRKLEAEAKAGGNELASIVQVYESEEEYKAFLNGGVVKESPDVQENVSNEDEGLDIAESEGESADIAKSEGESADGVESEDESADGVESES